MARFSVLTQGLVLLLAVSSTLAQNNKCIVGDDGTADGTTCDQTVCSQPMFTEYTGYATGVTYKCGACAGETQGSTCKQCDATTTACNTPAETGESFKCYTWSWSTDKFVKSAEMTTCQRLKTTSIACNQPDTEAKAEADYTNTKKGCGPCEVADQKTATKCKQCDKAECNAAFSGKLSLVLFMSVLCGLFFSKV